MHILVKSTFYLQRYMHLIHSRVCFRECRKRNLRQHAGSKKCHHLQEINFHSFIHCLNASYHFLLYFVCMYFLTGLHEATIKFSQNQTRFASCPMIHKALLPRSSLLVKFFTDNLVIEKTDNLNPRLRFSKLYI